MSLVHCPECNADVSSKAEHCPQCGIAAPGGARAGEDDFLDAAIGPANHAYYRRVFDGFKYEQRLISWNWPSFFATVFWMLYRKMYAYAVLVWFGLPATLVMLSIIVAKAFGNDELVAMTFFLSYLVVGFAIIPMFTNRLYYRHVDKQITRAISGHDTQNEQLKALYRSGGTSGAGTIGFMLFYCVGLVLVLGALAIPSHSTYTVRAQVSEGLNLSGGAKAGVTEYYLDRREYPIDNREAGVPPPDEISGKFVTRVSVEHGEIKVTYGNDAHKRIQGKVLVLELDGSDHPKVTWRCYSQDIKNRDLPQVCRSR